MDQKQVRCGLCHDHLHERLITFRVKTALDALKEQTPRAICNSPKHFVAFPLATGGDFGLLAASRPRITSRPPLGKTGFTFKQAQALLALGRPENPGPFCLEPGLAPRCIEVV